MLRSTAWPALALVFSARSSKNYSPDAPANLSPTLHMNCCLQQRNLPVSNGSKAKYTKSRDKPESVNESFSSPSHPQVEPRLGRTHYEPPPPDEIISIICMLMARPIFYVFLPRGQSTCSCFCSILLIVFFEKAAADTKTVCRRRAKPFITQQIFSHSGQL